MPLSGETACGLWLVRLLTDDSGLYRWMGFSESLASSESRALADKPGVGAAKPANLIISFALPSNLAFTTFTSIVYTVDKRVIIQSIDVLGITD